MKNSNINKLALCLGLISCLHINIYAQSSAVAEKYFNEFSFTKSAKLFEDIVRKGDSSKTTLQYLGDSYYKVSNTGESERWYSTLIKKYDNSGLSPEYYFKYAQSLRANGKENESAIWAKKYFDKTSNPEGLNQFSLKIDETLGTKKAFKNILPVSINTAYSDFSGYINGNKLYWYSSNTSAVGGKRYNWNQQPFLDIFSGTINKNNPSEISLIKSSSEFEKINTKYHEATIAITKDGKTMYFTRDDFKGKETVKGDKYKLTHLKLYKATKINEKWADVKELPFNNDSYSIGHPTLSPNEDYLYFVSNMPSSYGGTDIYKVQINGNDLYGSPINLGNEINTPGNEMFPFMSNDGILYFSSNGHSGFGLLDIFSATFVKGEIQVKNLGSKFNSIRDDFGFILDQSNDFGYFSSNKTKEIEDDEIYSFMIDKRLQTIEGFIYDDKTNQGLEGVTVRLFDEKGEQIKSVVTDKDGRYVFDNIGLDQTVTIVTDKENFRSSKISVVLDDTPNKKVMIDAPSLSKLIVDDQIVLNPIYFDLNKTNITTNAAYELEQIVTILNQNPKMIIALESYTDSRGNDKMNKILSDKRAKATRDYIYSRGIAKNRIKSAIGYGEAKLINKCSNGVPCTEEEHQQNRRSIFRIISN